MRADELSDRLDVIDVVNRSFHCIDAKDFDGYRSLLADTVHVDFGGITETDEHDAVGDAVEADALVASVRETIEPVAVTHHSISSHVVTLAPSGDEAAVSFCEEALLYHPELGDDLKKNTWVLYGRGLYRLRCTAGEWKIVATRLRRVHETGNVEMLAEVARTLRPPAQNRTTGTTGGPTTARPAASASAPITAPGSGPAATSRSPASASAEDKEPPW